MDAKRLVKLLAVVIALCLLAPVVAGVYVFFQFKGIQEEGQRDAARTQLNNIQSGIRLYGLQVGTLPSNLEALREKPNDIADPTRWKGPYFDEPIPADPWGNSYIYTRGDRGFRDFELRSPGPDGKLKTKDDIVVKPRAGTQRESKDRDLQR